MNDKKPILLIALTCLLASCQPPNQGDESVYRHALDGVPGSLDPAHAADIYSGTLVVSIFDTLYRYKYLARPYEIAPALARDFPDVSDDGLVWTIHLRENARFADDPAFENGVGRHVTAQDVVYSLRRHFDPATRSRANWLWRDRIAGLDEWGRAGADPSHEISGLKALNETTLKIELTRPYPQLIDTLAQPPAAVVPAEAVSAYGREFGIRPVGSGPFRLIRLDQTMAVLEPNPHFDRGVLDLAAEGYVAGQHGGYGLERLDGKRYPFLDRLEIHFLTEPTARWSSFIVQGEVDNVMVPPEQADRVLASRSPARFEAGLEDLYHGLIRPEAGFVFLGFNMANARIGHHPEPEQERRNRALRCAMRDGFDWKTRNASFYDGLGLVFPGVIPPIMPEFDSSIDQDSVEFDPENARRRMARHGWDPEQLPELVYGLEGSVHQRQMFEQFRAWMIDIGFPRDHLKQRNFGSFSEMIQAVGNRQLDIFLLSWNLAYPDAQYSLQLFYGPNAAPGANSFNYDNPAFDLLYEQATVLPPGPQRNRLYQRMNRMIIDDCVVIGSLSRTRIHLWKKRVRMVPDHEIAGAYFMHFVAVED